MTTGPQDLVYRPIHDPLYDMTRVPIPVDGDTNIRISQSYPSNSKGTGELHAPLNAGHVTTFNITQGAAMKFRWGTMALRLNMTFYNKHSEIQTSPVATMGAPYTGEPLNVPPWNMVASFIKTISLTINSGADLYTSTSDHFVEDFTARMITQYDYDTLNSMDMTLFTPIGAKAYSVLGDYATKVLTFPPSDPAVLERGRKYCQTATHEVTHTKIISFNDLFPRLPDAIFKNMRQIVIRIQWVNDVDLLDHFGLGPAGAENTQASVSLTGCDVITDAYVPASTQALDTISEKTEGTVDYLGYLTTQVFPMSYKVNNAIIIPSIKNFDSVLIYRPAKGLDNGKAGANKRTYASVGEFVAMCDATADNGLIKPRADHPEDSPAGSRAGFESVQISIGGQDYPSSPIICDKLTNAVHCFDPASLYYYYCLGVNRFGRRDFKPAIPYDVFRATMPFIYLRPFSSNGVKPTPEGRDLIIKLRGGADGDIIIVVFKTAVQTLSRDGVVKAYQ